MTSQPARWARQLAEEHAHLGRLFANVRGVLSHPALGELEPKLLPLMEEMADGVRRHMEYEEQDGYLAPVEQRRPSLAGVIEELRGEHATLQSMLAQIVSDVRARPGVVEFRERIAPRLGQWLDDVRDTNAARICSFRTHCRPISARAIDES